MVIVILVPNFNNPIKLVLPSIFFYETDNIHMWCNTILLDLMEIFKMIMDENDQFDRNVRVQGLNWQKLNVGMKITIHCSV